MSQYAVVHIVIVHVLCIVGLMCVSVCGSVSNHPDFIQVGFRKSNT